MVNSQISLQRDKFLIVSSVLLLVLTLAHDVDHVRQGRSLGSDFYAIGFYSVIAAIAMLWVSMSIMSYAPILAIAIGMQTVLGLLFIHVLPHWWTLSDSYGQAHVDNWSWAIVFLLMGAGFLLTIGGVIALVKGTQNDSPMKLASE